MTATTTLTNASIHTEAVVEQRLVEHLVSELGYEERAPADYDRALALDKEILLRFLHETQPEEWRKLEKQYAGSAETEFFKLLGKRLTEFGTLQLLRHGMKIVPGIHFRFCFFQPASGINPDLVRRYEANILSVIRQVRYSQKHENAIDVVLFVNGFPVATLELKNTLTGQNVRNAEGQYRHDRSPAGEPLLTFKRGALVHFALDQDLVSMTTHLRNGATRFLPFNRGRDGGAGNPDVPDDFRIAYLYRDLPGRPAVFGRETWLGILQHFLHLEREGDQESMIFPRYQQLDAVQKLTAHARAHGSGQNYLIQHSAGSGKSNTIAWTAHQIINLHDEADQPIFSSAIVVTDRVVLDRQLQGTVSQFEQTPGLVRTIDGTSRQLKEAIESGARIIVTTIQKFGTEHLKVVAGQANRTFAIIVDEAHGSQSGKSAQALADALTRDEQPLTRESVEDLIAAHQQSRGPQSNISYLAFTATPRHVTLHRFGVQGPDGLPLPFHLYSMRQAIEEGFILDVLQNFLTYHAYYELEKAIEEDPKFKTTKGRRQVARFAHLHPTAVGQKVEVIVEHFRRHVMREMDGRAKGMVVTGSRESAMRTFLGMRDYIKKQGYTDIRPLVAFSGELTVDGQNWTEAIANGFSEAQLTGKFGETDDFRLLVVAEKYQTGFDQPKLCAMYVDRKLAGLQAVQTLSRLNRTAPGKYRTFILDFQNTIEEIQEAFKPYFETTELEAPTDLNQVYGLQNRLMMFGVLDTAEINAFANLYYRADLATYDRVKLEAIINQAVARFKAIEEEEKKEEFRQLLKSFLRFYAFVAQIVRLDDTSLEKLSAYGEWLVRLLPTRELPADIEITDDMIRLHAFKIVQQEEGTASLAAGDSARLRAIHEFAAKPYTVEEEESLSEIIKSFNERHGTEFTNEDLVRFEQVNREILSDDMIEMLRNNPPDVVYTAFREAFFKGAINLFQRDAAMKSIILTDADAREHAIRHFFNRALHVARA
jgi:type I restriction enzyme, R subunit